MNLKCKVAIFYESHNDGAPSEAMHDMLPFLKKCGFTSFAAEEPIDKPFTKSLEQLKESTKLWNEVVKLDSLNSPIAHYITAELGIPIDDQEAALKFLNQFATNQARYDLATATLWEQLATKDIKYFAVDIPENDEKGSILSKVNAINYRDHKMHENIYNIAITKPQ